MQNQNVRSRTRAWAFRAAAETLKDLGVAAQVLDGRLPKNKPDVAGAMIGTGLFDWKACGSTILPGAICEHLTSTGGVMSGRYGQTPLTGLTPLERELLRFFVEHPLVRHTKTDLILNAWPDDPCPLERSDDSVYQVIRGLRTKIESNPSKPRYIITWRGSGVQEGGYQFYPKGR